ncbi:MAG: class I SAM-dependent methyltransferase [Nitrospira sp.]|jgi:ubiquinone/menaquinone biosynthesis C-methylase UbiE|nr:class I SAM-dependent methyltransferase [Nitrospira sp.]
MLTEPQVLAEESRIKAAYQKKKPAGYYSFFDPGNLFLVQEREKLLLKRLRQHERASLAGSRLLEVGCGSGHWLREFIKWGVSPQDTTGVDLRPEVLTAAARLCPEGVTLRCSNGRVLEFPDESFDLVLQSLVFTSVLDPTMKQQMAREMLRVLKKDGLIIWYDFHVDNPWNPNVRGVRKAEIMRLFPDCDCTFDRVSLALPVAKRLAPWSWLLCYVLDRLRLFNTHYLALIHKR